MFASLIDTLSEDWYSNDDNQIVKLYTQEDVLQYQVFSAYEIKTENYYTISSFASEDTFLSFLNTLKSRSIHDFNVDLSSDDHILTLSTCSNNSAYRTVLHAKRIEN